MDTDRNLLFGVLALQSDLIDYAQFAEACATWAARKGTHLADILIERGWITSEDKTDVERLMERKLKRHGGDLQATLDAVTDAGVREALVMVDAPNIQQTVLRLSSMTGHVIVDPLVRSGETKTRYTLSRLHGQGGLGRVWVARDGDLNREVALKELRPEKGANLEASRRFLVEAQVTGQLEHPNIVPVYELSRRPEDNQPFYTMRFVRGQTLRDAIASYHRSLRENRIDPLELPRLLGAFVSVCNAMAYAHSRGVVHRDLKPENVVMGAFGEVLVLDWGLAKLMDQDTGPHDSTTDLPVAITPAADGERTAAGRVMGTPAYMAPEQAEGRTELVDSRTDIYGLGAILFEILTGHPPHEGNSTADILNKIVGDKTPQARAFLLSVPAALNAICAQGMAKARSERYRKASDLAEEVQRWLADEPVSAYPDPLPRRLARWARRHRTATQAATAVVLAVAVISSVAALFVNRARQREAAAKNESRRLMAGFRKSTDSLLTVVGTGMKTVPGGARIRLPLLEEAAAAYEEYFASNQNDPQLQIEWGWALIRLGRARFEIGDYAGAEQTVRKAESVLASLAADAGHDPERLYAMAASRVDLAVILLDLGKLEEAEETLRGAVRIYEELEKREPESVRSRDALARTLVHLGNTLRDRMKYAEAELLLRRAVAIHEQVVDADLGEPRRRVGLVTSYKALGDLLRETGSAGALDALGTAIQECQTLVELLPDVPEYQERLASSRLDYGEQLYDFGRWREAAQFYEVAAESFEILAGVDPDVVLYHQRLAVALNNRGVVLRALGDDVEAEPALRRALEEFTSLVKFHPAIPAHHSGLANCRTSLGQLLRDAGRGRDAEDALRTAIAELQNLPGDELQMPGIQHAIAVARGNLGWTLFQLDQNNDAESALRAAIANSRELVERHPNVPGFAEAQAWRLQRLADLLHSDDRLQDAEQEYRKAIEIREQLAAKLPHLPDHQFRLAWLLTVCRSESLRDGQRAAAQAQKALDLAPDNHAYQTALGAAHFRAGDWNAGRSALEKSLAIGPGRDPAAGFFLAVCLWRLDHRAEGRQWFDRSTEWMQQTRPRDPELVYLRDEAAGMMK